MKSWICNAFAWSTVMPGTEQHLADIKAVMTTARREPGKRRFKDQGARWKRLRIICALLTRLRFCDAQGRADFRTSGGPGSGRKGFKPWFRHKHRATRDVRMAFGHWAALGLRVKKRYVALDSGCVWGGQLTAWRLEDGALFQVPGRD